MPPAITNGDAILIIFFLVVPVAALFFIFGAGQALSEIGKGAFAIDDDLMPKRSGAAPSPASPEVRQAEIRQLLEAKAFRQAGRGEKPIDVEAELEKILAEERAQVIDPELRAEVRDLVIARNERRARQGKEPLDVEEEIERQLRELENLGQ